MMRIQSKGGLTSSDNPESINESTRGPTSQQSQESSAQMGAVEQQIGTLADVGIYQTTTNEPSHVATFSDEQATIGVALKEGSEFKLGMDDQADLANFLKRPVLIHEFKWTQSIFNSRIHPFSLFLKNYAVARRVANFRNFRGDLHLKIVYNGNAFFFGRMLVDWIPMPPTDEITSSNFEYLMRGTQRLHAMINPTENEPVFMKIPFIWPYHGINLISATDLAAELGVLTFRTFNQLAHSNGATDGIRVSVFAWMENVDLGAPTLAVGQNYPVAPAVDERDGKVYKIATKTAKVASMFSDVPTISSYASALEKSSMGLAKAAKLFGWSKPEKDTGEFMIPQPTDDVCNTDGKDAVKRLVGDTSQGLTVDPRTLGLPAEDELAMSNLITRESLYHTFMWNQTQAEGVYLAGYLVDPMIFYKLPTASQYQFTPLALGALTHEQWTGDMNFRVEIVASKFHKGRLLVQYDPENNASGNTNVQYSHIMDLAECTNASFNIGWGQNTPFLTVAEIGHLRTVKSPTVGNGFLRITILNELVSPQSAGFVYVNVYVKGGKGLRFAKPTGHHLPRITAWENENPVIPAVEEVHEIVMMGSTTPENIFHEHHGEVTLSFRSLMKRYNLSYRKLLSQSAGLYRGFNLPLYPRPKEATLTFTYEGDLQDGGVWSSGTLTTLMGFLAPCFLGMRGGMRYMLECDRSTDDPTDTGDGMVYYRQSVLRSPVPYNTSSLPTNPGAQGMEGLAEGLMNGGAFGSRKMNRFIKVELPMYSEKRFAVEAYHKNRELLTNYDYLAVFMSPYSESLHINVFQSVAEDFGLYWFQCVPLMSFAN